MYVHAHASNEHNSCAYSISMCILSAGGLLATTEALAVAATDAAPLMDMIMPMPRKLVQARMCGRHAMLSAFRHTNFKHFKVRILSFLEFSLLALSLKEAS